MSGRKDQTSSGDFEPFDFLVPFGVVAALVGLWFLYAVFAPYALGQLNGAGGAGGECEVNSSPDGPFTAEWTLRYRDACGDFYPFVPLYVVGFALSGLLLIYGGTRNVRDKL